MARSRRTKPARNAEGPRWPRCLGGCGGPAAPKGPPAFSVVVPVQTVSETNRRDRWGLVKRKEKQRGAVFEAVAVELGKPGRSIPTRGPFYVRYTRVTSRVIWDAGNLPASVKAVEDQMCACIGVDDVSGLYQGAYTQEPRAGRPESVRIEVWGAPA